MFFFLFFFWSNYSASSGDPLESNLLRCYVVIQTAMNCDSLGRKKQEQGRAESFVRSKFAGCWAPGCCAHHLLFCLIFLMKLYFFFFSLFFFFWTCNQTEVELPLPSSRGPLHGQCEFFFDFN